MMAMAGRPRERKNEQTSGNLVGVEKDVDSRKTPCGGNGLVAMELGYDYGHSSSSPTMAQPMFQIQVQKIQPRRRSGLCSHHRRVDSAVHMV